MSHSLLDVAFWLPTADIQTAQDALYALAGAAAATGKTLETLPADPEAFNATQLPDAEHRARVIATIKQYRATLDANFGNDGGLT